MKVIRFSGGVLPYYPYPHFPSLHFPPGHWPGSEGECNFYCNKSVPCGEGIRCCPWCGENTPHTITFTASWPATENWILTYHPGGFSFTGDTILFDNHVALSDMKYLCSWQQIINVPLNQYNGALYYHYDGHEYCYVLWIIDNFGAANEWKGTSSSPLCVGGSVILSLVPGGSGSADPTITITGGSSDTTGTGSTTECPKSICCPSMCPEPGGIPPLLCGHVYGKSATGTGTSGSPDTPVGDPHTLGWSQAEGLWDTGLIQGGTSRQISRILISCNNDPDAWIPITWNCNTPFSATFAAPPSLGTGIFLYVSEGECGCPGDSSFGCPPYCPPPCETAITLTATFPSFPSCPSAPIPAYGDPVTLAASVTGVGCTFSPGPGCEVIFYDGSIGGAVLGTCQLESDFTCSIVLNCLSVGNHNIYAVFTGCGIAQASAIGPVTVTVHKATTKINWVSCSLGSWSVSVTSPDTNCPGSCACAPITGTVKFLCTGVVNPMCSGSVAGSCPVSGGCSISPAKNPGSDNVTAIYSGDANYSTSSAVGPCTLQCV